MLGNERRVGIRAFEKVFGVGRSIGTPSAPGVVHEDGAGGGPASSPSDGEAPGVSATEADSADGGEDVPAAGRVLPPLVRVKGEDALMSLLTVTAPNVSRREAFAQKELAMKELFAQLDIADSRALHRRLVEQRLDDELAERFRRLMPDRQQRLLAFLGDARRREIIAASRRGE